jgi:phosphoribosyl 1,2-cyclic phosphodiesterase
MIDAREINEVDLESDGVRLEFWGVRGTVPTPASDRLRHGGNTICLAACLADDEYVLLDCGTGARLLGKDIADRRRGRPTRIHLLFSHYHFDHVEGLPLFPPLYDPSMTIRIHGFAPAGRTVRETLESFVAPPYFPVRLSGTPAGVEYVELKGEPFSIGDLRVHTLPLNHPDGCIAYRLERDGRRIVFATDHEHGDPAVDTALAAFAEGSDYLIYDATYLPAEYESLRKGWGHSTWYAAIAAARAARAKNLVLFHHHPDHTDDELEKILQWARQEFPSTLVAREGMTIPL